MSMSEENDFANDGSSLLKMKDRLLDPSSAHGSCQSQASILSKLSLHSHDREYGIHPTNSGEGTEETASRGVSDADSGSLRSGYHDSQVGRGAFSDCVSQMSGLTTDSTSKKLSPLGIVVKKCARELQAEPPLSERRSQLILQSLLNILNNHSMETTSNALHNGTDVTNSAGNNAKRVAIDNGALPAITSVMKNYKHSSKLQSRAILILGSLGEDNAENQDAIADCHGTSFILAALLRPEHNKSSSLCLEACSALAKITSLSSRNASQLAHGDGVKTLRQVMQMHAKQVGIQQYAFQVLLFVAKQPAPPKTLLNQSTTHNPYVLLEFVEDPELMETLVESIVRHKKIKPILQMGGSLIYILATQGKPRTKSSLVWSKAVPVLLKVLKSFPSSGTTQKECLDALVALCTERPEARETVADDGLNYVLDAMMAHPRLEEVLKSACQLLQLICKDHTAAKVAKCLSKNSKYMKTLQSTRQQFPQSCGEIVSFIQLQTMTTTTT